MKLSQNINFNKLKNFFNLLKIRSTLYINNIKKYYEANNLKKLIGLENNDKHDNHPFEKLEEKSEEKPEDKQNFKKLNEAGPRIDQPRRFGVIILVVFVGGFLLWATLFKIESAAVAPGKIIIDTNRKTIQHLEGGIVKSLLVQEGSHVKMGQDLILLDPTQAMTALNLAQGQTDLLLARKAYLNALEENANEVTFPPRLLERQNDPKVAALINNAKELFESKKSSLSEGVMILEKKIEESKHEISSLNAQVKSYDEQLELLKQEIDSWLGLENKNYIDKPRLLSLKREAARLEGDKNEKLSLISRAEQQINETELQINHFKNETESENRKSLEETEYGLVSNLEKETSAKDVLARLAIKAPISGTVLNLKVHTIGGVVTPREPLMDIVPDQERLIVEARINPNDIDIVHPGLPAKVKLSAYKQRTTPTLDGKVVNVSADLLQDEKTNQSFYTARILVDQKELSKLKDVVLYPGMPVQVFIVIDKRTPLNYFLTPVFDSFARAFKEQ